jgi:predicted transglutaminase-like cysteine proteinase
MKIRGGHRFGFVRQIRNRRLDAKRKKAWRAKFQKHPVIYRAQNNNPRDVRTFLFDNSHILKLYVDHYNMVGIDDEDTMRRVTLWVIDHLQYIGDQVYRGQPEYWQNPEDTIITLKGDCEDGAILIKSLSLCAGVPDWKVKIMAGEVVGGGHAYCTFIRYDDTQVILDWCYWPNRLRIAERKPRDQETNYKL